MSQLGGTDVLGPVTGVYKQGYESSGSAKSEKFFSRLNECLILNEYSRSLDQYTVLLTLRFTYVYILAKHYSFTFTVLYKNERQRYSTQIY